ncbi:MAG: sel1 repeat family protein [Candidatus Melainabacteria bacterium]|nr:MAG: sel1 repeat family protein [Candidatus Melainabacteria bacterium]
MNKLVTLSTAVVLNLSVMPLSAEEVVPYQAKIAKLQQQANSGDSKAALTLGDFYSDSRNHSRDFTKAREFYEKATTAGDPQAMVSLAELLSTGFGGPLNTKRGMELLEKSANQGNKHAQYLLGRACMIGFSTVQKDFLRAFKYLQLSANSGEGDAECLLAYLYDNGLGVVKNSQKSAILMKSAKLHGCADGEDWIGKIYLYGLGQTPKF